MDVPLTRADSGARRTRLSAFMEPDEELVARTLDGDVTAFETLVRRHRGLVHRVVARVIGRNEAEDVTQDVFLRAFHRLGQFRGDAPFRAWLLRIAHNTALSSRAGRDNENDALFEEAADSMPSSSRTPAHALEDSERRERLTLKLQQIRQAHRTVIVLRDLEGLSYEEIAAVTETPLGSVKGRLFRARQELIEVLRHNTYDWELPDERASSA